MSAQTSTTRSRVRATSPRPARPAASEGRRRIAAALSRRCVRERLVLSLLLVERLYPIEVADALGISVRQVERTVSTFLSGLKRSLGPSAGRARTRALAGQRLRRVA